MCVLATILSQPKSVDVDQIYTDSTCYTLVFDMIYSNLTERSSAHKDQRKKWWERLLSRFPPAERYFCAGRMFSMSCKSSRNFPRKTSGA